MSEIGLAINVVVNGTSGTMLTVAVPEMLPWVAVMSRLLAGVMGAVKRPLALIVPTLFVHVGVIETPLPYWSKPLAVKVRVRPTVTVVGLGDTLIEANGPARISITAVPEIAPWVAVISWLLADVRGAVNRPLASIVPTLFVQVGMIETGLPYWSEPLAVKVRVRPTVTVVGLGDTLIEARGPTTISTTAVPEMLPWVAVISWPPIGVVGAVKTPLSIEPMLDVQVGVIDTELPY